MSRFAEKQIFKILLREAQTAGYEPRYVGAPGERDGVDIASGKAEAAVAAVFSQDDADVTFAKIGADPVEYRDGDEKQPIYEGFWVRLIGGNGTDFISDYSACADAKRIMDAVYKEIEA